MFSDVPRSRRFLGSSENPIFYDFDHFGTFQIGHPENAQILDFDNFGTFQTGHPEIPKIHDFDNFEHFPEITEFNWWAQYNTGLHTWLLCVGEAG